MMTPTESHHLQRGEYSCLYFLRFLLCRWVHPSIHTCCVAICVRGLFYCLHVCLSVTGHNEEQVLHRSVHTRCVKGDTQTGIPVKTGVLTFSRFVFLSLKPLTFLSLLPFTFVFLLFYSSRTFPTAFHFFQFGLWISVSFGVKHLFLRYLRFCFICHCRLSSAKIEAVSQTRDRPIN